MEKILSIFFTIFNVYNAENTHTQAVLRSLSLGKGLKISNVGLRLRGPTFGRKV